MLAAPKLTVKKLFLSPIPINETFLNFENILPNLELHKLKVKISTPPSYLHLQFTALQRRNEIQVTFVSNLEKTLLAVNWSLHLGTEGFETNVLKQYYFTKLEEIRVKMIASELSSDSIIESEPSKESVRVDSQKRGRSKIKSPNSRNKMYFPFFLHCSCPICGQTLQNPKELRMHRDDQHKTKKINL